MRWKEVYQSPKGMNSREGFEIGLGKMMTGKQEHYGEKVEDWIREKYEGCFWSHSQRVID